MKKTTLSISIMLVLLAFGSQTLEANKAIIIMQTGKVTVQKSGQTSWKQAKVKDVLNTGDLIRTGPASTARLSILDDGGILSLNPESKLLISETARPKGKAPSFLLFLGNIVGKINKNAGKDLDINTPTAVVGVRGTELQIAVAEDGTSKVGVINGLVALDGKRNSVSLSSNEASIVPLDGEPQDKQFFTDKDSLEKWKADIQSTIKGREVEILNKVSTALERNYSLMKDIESEQQANGARLETLKAEKEACIDQGDTAGTEKAANAIGSLIGDNSRLIVRIYGIDWQNQSIFEIAERLYTSNKGNTEIKTIYERIKTGFDAVHSKYVRTPVKKGCL